MSVESPEPDDEPVPKLPYGRGLKLDKPMLFRIFATLILLVLIVVAARPCANATSKFVTDFDEKKGSASDTMPKPGNVDQGLDYERMGGTPEEDRAAYERAKAKARARAGLGSGSSGSAASGSASTASGSASTGSGSASSGSASSGSASSGSASSANSGSAR